jgi:hypothetical protein
VLTDETRGTSRFSYSGFHVAQGRVWSEMIAFVRAKAGLAASRSGIFGYLQAKM